ncbi:MAG: SDR family NAD(P)-dependent oxidoreductase [Bdellovibrionales bacterium]
MAQIQDLKSGYVIVTGASSGIGRAMALQLAQQGQPLVLVARRLDRLEKLSQQISSMSAAASALKVKTVMADLSTEEGVSKVLGAIADLPITGLINNAGVGDLKRFDRQDWAVQHNMIRLNVMALNHLTAVMIPRFIQQGFGRVLNVASTAAFQPGPYFAVYSATKAYVLSLSLALNEELRGTGVTVSVLCPGMTESEFHSHADTGHSKGLSRIHKASAEQVAAKGLALMKNGESFAIAGVLNKVMAFSNRMVPMNMATKIAAKILRPQN